MGCERRQEAGTALADLLDTPTSVAPTPVLVPLGRNPLPMSPAIGVPVSLSAMPALAAACDIDPEIRGLLVSGYTADESTPEILALERVEFPEKPFAPADLAESLPRLTGPR